MGGGVLHEFHRGRDEEISRKIEELLAATLAGEENHQKSENLNA